MRCRDDAPVGEAGGKPDAANNEQPDLVAIMNELRQMAQARQLNL